MNLSARIRIIDVKKMMLTTTPSRTYNAKLCNRDLKANEERHMGNTLLLSLNRHMLFPCIFPERL